MMAVTNPALNSRVSLRYNMLLFPISYLASFAELTTWWFALDATVINLVLLQGSFKFWRKLTEKTARKLFFLSIIHLPVILALMMFHKKEHHGVRNDAFLENEEGDEDVIEDEEC
jgi:protoheme IX farnesyltransferase